MHRIYVAYVHIDKDFLKALHIQKTLVECEQLTSAVGPLYHSLNAPLVSLCPKSNCADIGFCGRTTFQRTSRIKKTREVQQHTRKTLWHISSIHQPQTTLTNPNSLNSLNSNVRAEGTIGHHKEPTPSHGPSWQSAKPDGVPRSRQTRQAQALRLCTARPEAGAAGFWRISNQQYNKHPEMFKKHIKMFHTSY